MHTIDAGDDCSEAELRLREATARNLLSEHSDWSDRRIAEAASISPKTVARMRSRVVGDGEPQKRIGRDGRARPVHPAAVREQVAEAIRRDPGASLRTIARLLQVSPETVRSVRTSMNVSIADNHRSLPLPAALEVVYQRELPAPWRRDAALTSADSGEEFISWFDATLVDGNTCDRAGQVPLSRVYEIADEARRRAGWWIALAETLEGRTRRRYSA